jgi:hypothetical protein
MTNAVQNFSCPTVYRSVLEEVSSEPSKKQVLTFYSHILKKKRPMTYKIFHVFKEYHVIQKEVLTCQVSHDRSCYNSDKKMHRPTV